MVSLLLLQAMDAKVVAASSPEEREKLEKERAEKVIFLIALHLRYFMLTL